MADRGRGGYQQPRNPAAVSNPGSGRRTDGGAGSKGQPLRVPSGGAYGQRKATIEQQQGAPLASGVVGGGSGSPAPAQPSGPSGSVAGQQPAGIFGPTERPNEPNSAMPNAQLANPAAASPQQALRVLYSKFPHPAIARLIDWSAVGSRGIQQ